MKNEGNSVGVSVGRGEVRSTQAVYTLSVVWNEGLTFAEHVGRQFHADLEHLFRYLLFYIYGHHCTCS